MIRRNSLKHQDGSSLLEVMIAGVLFMVGLLGLLATQGLSLKLSTQSVDETNASVLIADLYDRMRANPDGTDNNGYTTAIFNAVDIGSVTDCAASTANCTSLELAQYDLAVWKANVTSRFPAATTARVDPVVADSSQYNIQLVWLAQVDNDANSDGVKDAQGSNCANGENRPANERAVCSVIDVGVMEIF